MAGFMLASLEAIAPTPPDFHVCDPYFGHGAFPWTCEDAVNLLPRSNMLTTYLVHHPTATQYTLPFSVTSGHYQVSAQLFLRCPC